MFSSQQPDVRMILLGGLALALAAAGGWMAYRAWTQGAPRPAPADHIPPADSPTADIFLRSVFEARAAGLPE